MKNKILSYDTETVGNYIVSDYFSKKIDIYKLFSLDLTQYLDVYKMPDDDKLERVSYELYGTTDYWDLLLMLNDRNPLFDMPYNFDNLSDGATEFVNKYSSLIYFNSPLNETRTAELIEEWKSKVENQNDKLRFLYIIKPTQINNFIKLLRDKGYL